MIVAASPGAAETDWLMAALLGASVLVLVLVFGLMFIFLVRYRHDSGRDRGPRSDKTWRMEVAWTAATLVAFFGLFVWGADLYVRAFTPRAHPLTIIVVGKQWMWKIAYPGGQSEINALHLPVGTDVQLLLASEDVIHDFGLPEFRLKRDVVPGRYESLWLHADRIGTYHLFCNQFCGTDHAAMVGTVTVLSGPAYQQWLDANRAAPTLAADGRALFIHYGCAGCHLDRAPVAAPATRAPPLAGIYMAPQPLADGSTVIADDRYIHDSILYPAEQVVAGYQPVMPSFNGVIGEEDLVKIIAYIRSLAATDPGAAR